MRARADGAPAGVGGMNAGEVRASWNTSRGPVVNTAALVKALESGKVAGAALDVLEYEKTSFEAMDAVAFPEPLKQLVNFENVILSPHIAGWTIESKYKLAKVLADKIRAWYLGYGM